MAAEKTLHVYAFYVSQPSRALLWLLRINDIKFEFHNVDILAGDQFKPEFLAMNPSHTVPTIKDENGALYESSAIMHYLAEKNDLSKWYPKDLQVRSRILQYLSWHTSHVRKSTSDLLHPVVGAAFGGKDLDKEAFAKAQESFTKQLQLLEGWLENSKFLATDDHPTIADLQAYCEIDQIEAFNLMDLSPFKKVQAWIAEMKKLPQHDEVREMLYSLKDKLTVK